MKFELVNEVLYLYPEGRIDTNNSRSVQEDIDSILTSHPGLPVVIDADDLEYISSSGLRVILYFLKKSVTLSIINANSTVYEILDTTGFTEMLDVKKAYKKISVEGCEIIGEGSNGLIYRTDPETIVKVYKNPDSLPDIENERRLARYTFIHGIPTAISYDIVRVGNTYGSVFEMLNAKSLTKLFVEQPENIDEYVKVFVDLLKTIHEQKSEPGDVPDIRKTYLKYAAFLKEYIPAEAYEKLYGLIEAVPQDLHLIHGDYYMNNVMIQDGTAILIDLDTLSCGAPVFEFSSTFNAYVGFSSIYRNGETFARIFGEKGRSVWRQILAEYYPEASEEELDMYHNRAALLGYTRILRRHIRRCGTDTEERMAQYNNCREKLLELIGKVDSLT